MQCHGAMGYTWEVDLQIFMKKAWVYNNAWGVVAWHQGRVSDFVFADQAIRCVHAGKGPIDSRPAIVVFTRVRN